ncbi:MAG: glycosyltransferase family 2 protein [Methanomicrobiales archaeon]|nr:glycosyltransferase family 2 protein [Methanomicrobiales archaeon]
MISIVIPLFNERENVLQYPVTLFPVIDAIGRKFGESLEYVMVDDGSSDDTLDQLDALAQKRGDVRVVVHEKNRGMGAAFRTGIAASRGEIIVTMDADLTYRPEEVEKLLACYYATGADCVYGSPYCRGGEVENLSYIRLLPSLGVNILYRAVLWKNISCVTSIIRAYRATAVRTITIENDSFDAAAEILAKMIFRGMRIASVPMTLHVRTHGCSKMDFKKEVRNHARLLVKMVGMRMRRNT